MQRLWSVWLTMQTTNGTTTPIIQGPPRPRIVGLDLETELIQPGLLTPPIVCGSVQQEGEEAQIVHRDEILTVARRLLEDSSVRLGLANGVFDFGCLCAAEPSLLPLVFKAYEDGRVHDILITQSLDAIAGGHLNRDFEGRPLKDGKGRHTDRYSLDIVVKLNLGRDDAKVNDFYRLRYAILKNIPMADWPEEALQYPKDDARNQTDVAVHQLTKPFRNLEDLAAQCETAWALHLGAIWGFRTDPANVAALEKRSLELHDEYIERFKKKGFFKPDGTEDTAAVARAVVKAYGCDYRDCPACGGVGKVQAVKKEPCRGVKHKNKFQGCLGPGASGCVCQGTGEVQKLGSIILCRDCSGSGYDLDPNLVKNLPRTAKGGVSTSRDTLSESGDEDLAEYGENKHEKILKTYLPFLKLGLHRPITLSPNVLLESGRVSYNGLIQTFPRWKLEGAPSPRECFVAREGRVFGSTDYSALELVTLAQTCLWVVGESKMAQVINESKDPGNLHTALGAKLMNISLDEMKARIAAKDSMAKAFRQSSKVANFGLPGGMQAATMVLSARRDTQNTTGPDGQEYKGIRFCIMIGGARRCGEVKVTEWKRQAISPTCLACLKLAEDQLIPAWFAQWPEMRLYFEWVKNYVDREGSIPSFGPWFFQKNHQTRSPHRVRGGVNWRNAANNSFQGLAADGCKAALRAVTREAYLDESSPLYRGVVRVPAMIHDELLTEGNLDTAHLWGPRVAEIMIAAMREWVPDVWTHAETALQKFWNKNAEPVYQDGKLIVWTPPEKRP